MDIYFKTRFQFNRSRDKVWKAICKYLQKYVDCDSNILELGTGYGNFINNIKAKNKFAIDISSETINYLNEGIRFFNQSIFEELSVEKRSLDVIFASNFFEHFNDDELNNVFNKIVNLLKDDGRLILIQPNYVYCYRNYFDDYTHKKVFSHNSMYDFLVSKGFTIEYFDKKFIPFSFNSKLPKSYILTLIYLKNFYHPFAKQMLFIAKKNNV